MATPTKISVVNLAPFLDGTQSDKQHVAQSIVNSFRKSGFVYLLNHGVDEEKLKGMFDWSKRFFNLPMEVKQLAPHPKSARHHRGYSSPGQEKITQHVYDREELKAHRNVPDAKESFESGREDDPISPNIWLPEGNLPGFREACMDFFYALYDLELVILRAIALGLGLEEDYLTKSHNDPECQLRLLHYPSVSVDDLHAGKLDRAGAHSDFGNITLLFQDKIGGLQVEDPENPGNFIEAPPIPRTVIVNAGDLLTRWTNGLLHSAVHRVKAPPTAISGGWTPERYSIPFFCSPDYDTIVDCLPGTWSDENPKKYEPVTAGEYYAKRLETMYE